MIITKILKLRIVTKRKQFIEEIKNCLIKVSRSKSVISKQLFIKSLSS